MAPMPERGQVEQADRALELVALLRPSRRRAARSAWWRRARAGVSRYAIDRLLAAVMLPVARTPRAGTRPRARFRPPAPLSFKGRCRPSSSTPSTRPPPTSRRRSTASPRASRRATRVVTLLGATGTGKTMTMAATIEARAAPGAGHRAQQDARRAALQRVPHVLPATTRSSTSSPTTTTTSPRPTSRRKDLYIEKDSAINQEIDRLRHAATAALFARRDVIIVASVSAIFGLGSPETYDDNMPDPRARATTSTATSCCASSSRSSTTATTPALGRGTFRVRGDTLEVFPAYAETAFRATLFGDEVERLQHFDPLTGELIARRPRARRDLAGDALQRQGGHDRARGRGDRARAQRAHAPSSRPRASCSSPTACASARSTTWRCCARSGFCSGIENYSRILDGRTPGARPYCLIDYFPDDFVCFIDESHQTVPQIGGMYEGDRSRKQTLVDYGFRLPSALDNRPQTFDEFLSITPQMVFVSATPGEYEREHSATDRRADRPPDRASSTPTVEVRETRNQIDDLMNEIRARVDRDERVLVTTLTKKMSRGPHGLPARDGLQGPLPALRDRHARAHPDHPRAAPRRVRRARRRQPAARGPRPARGLAGGDPRRRQGGLPPRRDVADPDDRPRGAQRRRHGAHVRRQGDGGDARGDRARPTAAARSRSPTTRSTASRRRRSSRASPTSPSS